MPRAAPSLASKKEQTNSNNRPPPRPRRVRASPLAVRGAELLTRGNRGSAFFSSFPSSAQPVKAATICSALVVSEKGAKGIPRLDRVTHF